MKEKTRQTCFSRFGAKTYAESALSKKLHYERLLEDKNVVPMFSFEEYMEHFNEKHSWQWKWKCLKCGNVFSSNFRTSYYKAGKGLSLRVRCPQCYPLQSSFSKQEKEVAEFVKSIYSGKVLENCFDVLEPNEENGWKSNHELDIWLPSLSLAIEYNGDYFHDYERFPEVEKNDNFKKIQCEAKSIKLITVWEHDWLKDKAGVEKMLEAEIMERVNGQLQKTLC